MTHPNHDFFNSTTNFETMISDLKQSLYDSVQEEHQQKMEQLQKENEELLKIKENFESIKMEFENRRQELESEYQTLKENVRKERVSELMKDYEVVYYSLAFSKHLVPKCDKCDDNRNIPFLTPLGKKRLEECDCKRYHHLSEPIPAVLYEFRLKNGEGVAWYKIKDSGDNERLYYREDKIDGNNLITEENEFAGIGSGSGYLFQTKELAQRFCDDRNAKKVQR